MRLTVFGFKGVLFYVAMVGAFFASPYSNLFFLLLGFLTLQWVLSLAWTRRNMRGVTATLHPVEPAPAGAGQPVRVTLSAPGRARFQITAGLELDDAGRVVGQAAVVDGEEQLVLDVPPLPRGIYPLDGAFVSSAYPLGLLEMRHGVDVPGDLVVYPTPVDLVAKRTGEALSEALGERMTGAGDLQPAGLRDHREGDETRSIHWRATARRGSLVVKELEGGSADGLEVLVDRRCEAAALEEALSVISALVGIARANKEVLVLHSQGLSSTFGPGHRPWNEALRFLAGAEALPANAPAPPPVCPSVTRLPLVAGHER